jgi:hypothetical protein
VLTKTESHQGFGTKKARTASISTTIMRVLYSEKSQKSLSPHSSPTTPTMFVSPRPANEGATPKWQEKLRVKNKLASKWSHLNLESSGLDSVQRSDEEFDSVFGSKSSIEYLHDDDDVANNVYWDAKEKTKEQVERGRRKALEKQTSGYNFDELLSDDKN